MESNPSSELESKSTSSSRDQLHLLNVPEIGEVSRRSSCRSDISVDVNSSESPFRRRSAKWFDRIKDQSDSISRESIENKSTTNHVKLRQKRKQSIFAKKGRSIRKRMSAVTINEVDSGDEGSGRNGYVLTTDEKLRIFALREIVETENSYTKLLQFLVDVMIPNLQRCVNDDMFVSVTEKTINNLLSNISEIHKLHVKFTSELQEESHPYPYHTNCIGRIFLKYRQEFTAYSQYCSNFVTAQRVSYDLEKDPALQNFIEDWRKSIACNTRKFSHLEEFIIAPVQRLCKYPLLLKELIKYTNENHPDHNDVVEAKKIMEDITMSVNESQRKAIAMKAIKDLEDACDSWEKSGNLSKNGFMTKQGGSVKTWNIRWFILRGYTMSYYSEPTDQKPQGVLDLTSYKGFEEDATHTARPHSFGIQMQDRTYYMYCTSDKEKQEWVTILRWKFGCIERSRSQAHRPLETVIFASLSSFINPKNQQLTFNAKENPIGEENNRYVKPRRTRSLFGIRVPKVRSPRHRVQSHN